MKEIKIKYHTDITRIKSIDVGDWHDLRTAEEISIDPGEFYLIPLGVSIKLPKGYEAHMVPRSSTFKRFSIMQTNSFAIIDGSYCGNDDQWFFPAISLSGSYIKKDERIAQFRIIKKQPELKFTEVTDLSDKDRGGIGSTNKN
jgi:dUTP pyrophosphatase